MVVSNRRNILIITTGTVLLVHTFSHFTMFYLNVRDDNYFCYYCIISLFMCFIRIKMMIIKNDFDKVIAKTTMLMLIPS